MAQLGRAVSILKQYEDECNACYEELHAFHAPSECYRDVNKGNKRRFRQVKRHACHIAGVKNLPQLLKRVKKVCPTWDRFNHFHLGIEAIYHRHR